MHGCRLVGIPRTPARRLYKPASRAGGCAIVHEVDHTPPPNIDLSHAWSGTGRLGGEIWTAIERTELTSTLPLESRISPRGAGTSILRTKLTFACARYLSPESTCRYQRRKKTIANIASAKLPRTATRNASWGVRGGRLSSGTWIITPRSGGPGRAGRTDAGAG